MKKEVDMDVNVASAFTGPGCFRLFRKSVMSQLQKADNAEFQVDLPPSGGEMSIIQKMFPHHKAGVGYREQRLFVFVERQ
jgi:hypothetical protein